MESTNKDLQLTQIRHKIDGLMDLLFGAGVASHHTIIEQINYLMFLRALTKRDDEAMKIDNADKLLFTGSFAKYRWDNLLMLNAEDLFTTLEKIYRELPNITPDSTVALLYRDAHVKIYEKPTLRRLLHEIEKLMSELEADAKQGSKDIFGDMYEYLLSKQSQAGTMGQFRTPRHIIRFITEIVDPSKNETILDPACGTAGFLVAAFQHLERKYTSEKFQEEGRFPMDLLEPSDRKFIYQHAFTGFDSDSDMIKFGLMNLYLHQLEHPQIIRQNTLVDTAGNRDKWNIILANPPFSGALDKDSISEDLRMGTRATEILFLRYMIDHLKENGRAGVIVPEGVIFSNSTAHKKIRQVLVDEAGLWCVVSLPAGIFNPYAGVKTSVLFFDKSLKGKAKDILFVKIENDGFDLGAQKRPIDKNDLPHAKEVIINYRLWLLANQKLSQNDFLHEPKVLLVSKQKIAESEDYNLSADRYKEEIYSPNNEYRLVILKDICEINKKTSDPITLFGESEFVYIDISSVENGTGKANFENKVSANKAPSRARRIVENGDVLLSTVRPNLKAFAYLDHLPERILASTGFAVLSAKKEILPKYLFYQLFSNNMQNQIISMMGKGAYPSINQSDVERLKIILPPIEIQQQIVDELDVYQKIISGAKQVVENWKPKIDINPKWEKLRLGEVCEVGDGNHSSNYPKSSEMISSGVPFIRGTNLVDGKIDSTDIKYISKEKHLQLKKGHLKTNDVLFTNRGEIGKVAIVNERFNNSNLNSQIAWLRSKEKLLPVYLISILMSDYTQNQLLSLKQGATLQQFTIKQLSSFKIPLPPLEIQEAIVKKIEEEKKLVEGNKKLIEIYEQKIKSKIAGVWGE